MSSVDNFILLFDIQVVLFNLFNWASFSKINEDRRQLMSTRGDIGKDYVVYLYVIVQVLTAMDEVQSWAYAIDNE